MEATIPAYPRLCRPQRGHRIPAGSLWLPKLRSAMHNTSALFASKEFPNYHSPSIALGSYFFCPGNRIRKGQIVPCSQFYCLCISHRIGRALKGWFCSMSTLGHWSNSAKASFDLVPSPRLAKISNTSRVGPPEMYMKTALLLRFPLPQTTQPTFGKSPQ